MASPMVLATVLAAGAVRMGRGRTALVLAAAPLGLALLLVPVYLLGLLHLPQALVAVGVTTRWRSD